MWKCNVNQRWNNCNGSCECKIPKEHCKKGFFGILQYVASEMETVQKVCDSVAIFDEIVEEEKVLQQKLFQRKLLQ